MQFWIFPWQCYLVMIRDGRFHRPTACFQFERSSTERYQSLEKAAEKHYGLYEYLFD